MSQNFKKLILIDTNGVLCWHNALTHEKLFEESNKDVDGVAMNQYFADMFCYSSSGTLNIKTGDFNVIRQKGKFEEAAEFYAKQGNMDKALSVFSDLKLFDEGHEWVQRYSDLQLSSTNDRTNAVNVLLEDQMKWSEETNDARESFQLCLKTERYSEAVDMIERHQWPEATLKVANELVQEQESLLERCATVSIRHGRLEEAENILQRISNIHPLIKFYCSTAQWSKLHALVDYQSEYWKETQIAYGGWLEKKNDIEGALQAYCSCKAIEHAVLLLENQIKIHTAIEAFSDVSGFYWRLSRLTLAVEKSTKSIK
eukprot:g3672.t1